MLPLHSFASQVSSSVSSGQASPPCFASWATPLDLDLLVLAPLLVQITLHLLHDDQSSTLQSTEPSHWSVLQNSSCSKAGQTAPPFSASRTIPLPLVLVSPPQVALQSDHDDQSSTSQSTGMVENTLKADEIVMMADIMMVEKTVMMKMEIIMTVFLFTYFHSNRPQI